MNMVLHHDLKPLMHADSLMYQPDLHDKRQKRGLLFPHSCQRMRNAQHPALTRLAIRTVVQLPIPK